LWNGLDRPGRSGAIRLPDCKNLDAHEPQEAIFKTGETDFGWHASAPARAIAKQPVRDAIPSEKILFRQGAQVGFEGDWNASQVFQGADLVGMDAGVVEPAAVVRNFSVGVAEQGVHQVHT